jgi:hypothetical protein
MSEHAAHALDLIPTSFGGLLDAWGRPMQAHGRRLIVPAAAQAFAARRTENKGGRKPAPKPRKDKPGREERPRNRLKRAPGEGRCCAGPEDLVTPQGEQQTHFVREYSIGGGVGSVHVRPKPFVREATFHDEEEGCVCTCCEYREQMKGKFRARLVNDNHWGTWAPILDFTPEPDGSSGSSVEPSETEWRDISLFVPGAPGNPIRVGRRSDLAPRRSPQTGETITLEQDYDSECTYWLDFYPDVYYLMWFGFLYVEIDATFRAAIVDICNDNEVVVGWNEWTWKFEGEPARRA